MKLTSVMEGQMVGHGLMERGNKPDGNPLRGQARSWAVGETWHVVTCEVFVMHQYPDTWLGSTNTLGPKNDLL